MADIRNNDLNDDNIQHGIDDNPSGDAEKGATLGGIGGALTGLAAGAVAGPLGAIAGAVIGGVAGAVASGVAVAAVDRHDNDNTVSGLGHGATTDVEDVLDRDDDTVYTTTPGAYTTTPGAYGTSPVGNGVPGIQTGGHDIDGTPDTRGILEKTADTLTGDRWDDKTGKPVASDTVRSDAAYVGSAVRNDVNYAANRVDNAVNSGLGTGISQERGLGETMPSIKTGGVANDGTPDTRGVGEKVVDGVTGDDIDDKTGKRVNHA